MPQAFNLSLRQFSPRVWFRPRTVTFLTIVIIAFLLCGCGQRTSAPIASASAPATQPAVRPVSADWGPGVADLNVLSRKLKLLLKSEDERADFAAQAVLKAATFEQACLIYRSCRAGDEGFRVWLLGGIVSDQGDWVGRTRREVTALLGEPDENDDDGLTYTGCGPLTDSKSAKCFTFGPAGRIVHFSCAN